MGVLLLVFRILLVAFSAFSLHRALPGLVQVVLQTLAHVVVNLGLGVCCCQFLALGNHREDTADNHRTAGVDLHRRILEDLWEILCHTLADAMMLALTNSRQIAQTLDGCGVESLQLLQHLFAQWCQLTCLTGVLQRVHRQGVLTLPDQPARTMTTIMAHIIRFVALRGRCQSLCGQLTVIIQIVTASQIVVSGNLVLSGSLKQRGSLGLRNHRTTDGEY